MAGFKDIPNIFERKYIFHISTLILTKHYGPFEG